MMIFLAGLDTLQFYIQIANQIKIIKFASNDIVLNIYLLCDSYIFVFISFFLDKFLLFCIVLIFNLIIFYVFLCMFFVVMIVNFVNNDIIYLIFEIITFKF